MVELLVFGFLLATQTPDADLEGRLAAAIHAEVVTGDLAGAVSQYSAILAQVPHNRSIAARALWHMAQCQEQLGQRAAARATYTRLVHEFADEADIAAHAREKLASWTRTPQGPLNLDFERGEAGKMPLGWTREGEGSVELRREGCRGKLGCTVVAGPGRMVQDFSAAAYRGKTVRLRAWLRLDMGGSGDRAQLCLGVDGSAGQQAAVSGSRWTQYEIASEVDANAQSIQLGVLSSGRGRVWIDGVSFQAVPDAEMEAMRSAIQALYGRFDSAYLQGDFSAITRLTAGDAQYHDADVKEPFPKAVDRWKGLVAGGTELALRTTVTDFHLAGNAAIVTARAEYVRSEANRTRSTTYVATRRDTWLRDGAGWRMKEYRVLTTRQVDSSTDAQTAKRAAADLKRTAAPLATIEVGHTFYDVAPFGTAVGDARIVALGEATMGTREFFQIKHRLLEYLVREKGFTVFAISANWQEAIRLDLYVKSGDGDAKALLTGMLWPWNTEEELDVLEWMREFNQAPGNHPTLRVAGFGIPPASVVIEQVVDYLKQCSPLDAVTAQTNYAPLLEMESKLGEVYDDAASRAAEKAEAVVRLLDAKRDALVQVSSVSTWSDARQAAETARQNAATRIAGKGSAYRNEMMARNIEWLAKEGFPGEKIVVWAHNAQVDLDPGAAEKSVGRWLREEFGEQIYVTGFAFHRGELLAIGVRNGNYEGVARQTIPGLAEGNGDSVLSAAGMPVFFLDLRTVPSTTALGRWLAEPHSFLEVRELWNRDDPQSNSRVMSMAKSYDGLVFLEEGHAAHGL